MFDTGGLGDMQLFSRWGQMVSACRAASLTFALLATGRAMASSTYILVTHAKEKANVTSYVAGTGVVSTVTNQHVLTLYLNGHDTRTYASARGAGYDNQESFGYYIAPEMGFESSTGVFAQSNVKYSDYSSDVWPTALGIALTGQGEIAVQWRQGNSSQFAVNGGTARVILKSTRIEWYWNGTTWVQNNIQSATRYDITVDKRLCSATNAGDASIDTRIAYGNSNAQGQITDTDSNSTGQNVHFGKSSFHGGLFVGHTIFSADKSRLARTQLVSASGTPTNYECAVASLYNLGANPQFTGSITIGSFLPAATATNVNDTDLTWATRWSSIAPRSQVGSPPDWAQDPLSTLAIADDQIKNDFANWSLVPSDSQYDKPTFYRLCLALTDETSTSGWQYFAGSEYNGAYPNSNSKDWAPRIWVLSIGGQTIFTP